MKRFLFALILFAVPSLALAQPNWNDYEDGTTIIRLVNTVGTDGVAETIASEEVVAVLDGTTVVTAGITIDDDVSLDFGGGAAAKVGLHKVTIVTTEAGWVDGDYELVYKAGTVDSVSVVPRVLATFSLGRNATAEEVAEATTEVDVGDGTLAEVVDFIKANMIRLGVAYDYLNTDSMATENVQIDP
jgi:hypothetical protein